MTNQLQKTLDYFIAAAQSDVQDRIDQLQAENEALRNGLVKIIEMNRQHAEDQYGDPEKAESWSCVNVARVALNKEKVQ
ncbi:hypothetical protein [Pseudomonas sp. GM67]|uniref:hypothetical protein n=1 Tax=Pseudomonas sp. GM67 TaxID=1144335 RepID=UPI000270C390|nr:hypothetical protein [Pseudomonas sp. GM67]EJM92478.1 hypothetical protein PMI33_00735 [Pseudomonas sp. GM67]